MSEHWRELMVTNRPDLVKNMQLTDSGLFTELRQRGIIHLRHENKWKDILGEEKRVEELLDHLAKVDPDYYIPFCEALGACIPSQAYLVRNCLTAPGQDCPVSTPATTARSSVFCSKLRSHSGLEQGEKRQLLAIDYGDEPSAKRNSQKAVFDDKNSILLRDGLTLYLKEGRKEGRNGPYLSFVRKLKKKKDCTTFISEKTFEKLKELVPTVQEFLNDIGNGSIDKQWDLSWTKKLKTWKYKGTRYIRIDDESKSSKEKDGFMMDSVTWVKFVDLMSDINDKLKGKENAVRVC